MVVNVLAVTTNAMVVVTIVVHVKPVLGDPVCPIVLVPPMQD